MVSWLGLEQGHDIWDSDLLIYMDCGYASGICEYEHG
jgi:hypothetical protein